MQTWMVWQPVARGTVTAVTGSLRHRLTTLGSRGRYARRRPRTACRTPRSDQPGATATHRCADPRRPKFRGGHRGWGPRLPRGAPRPGAGPPRPVGPATRYRLHVPVAARGPARRWKRWGGGAQNVQAVTHVDSFQTIKAVTRRRERGSRPHSLDRTPRHNAKLGPACADMPEADQRSSSERARTEL